MKMITFIDYKFNNKLFKYLREQYKMSVKMVAQDLEVHRNTITSLESGKFQPSLNLAIKISVLFKEPLNVMVLNTSVRQCYICGCSDHNACQGGCWWVEDDLCSSCEKKIYDNQNDLNGTLL